MDVPTYSSEDSYILGAGTISSHVASKVLLARHRGSACVGVLACTCSVYALHMGSFIVPGPCISCRELHGFKSAFTAGSCPPQRHYTLACKQSEGGLCVQAQ